MADFPIQSISSLNSQWFFDGISLGVNAYRQCVSTIISEIQIIRQDYHFTTTGPIVVGVTLLPWLISQSLIYGPILGELSEASKIVRGMPPPYEVFVSFFHGRNGNISPGSLLEKKDFTRDLFLDALARALFPNRLWISSLNL